MRELTIEEIQKFASRKGCKAVAVTNFLGTMGTDPMAARINASEDARSYRWNAATQKAIRDGINLACKGGR